MYTYIQHLFFRQWKALRNYAHKKGVGIIGDVPIYVALDSADVWASPESFQLDKNGFPVDVAGVPPDYFSADGQLWGNPLYNWAEMEKDGFSWWKERISFALELFDGVRIDHFRGFESFWAVKGTEKTAKNGKWVKGPGMKLINVFNEVKGDKLIIAEDLGDITEDVIKLVEESGFPGMRVFQFGFLSMWDTPHRPYNYINNCVAYSGTHDNNTLLGYLWETPEDMKRKVMQYCSCNYDRWNEDGCKAIIKTIMASNAGLTIFPVQDLLGYGSDTRLNVPGRADGNWLYRVTKEQIDNINKHEYKELNELFGR
jgi:4-alpha-glucanotransferase